MIAKPGLNKAEDEGVFDYDEGFYGAVSGYDFFDIIKICLIITQRFNEMKLRENRMKWKRKERENKEKINISSIEKFKKRT